MALFGRKKYTLINIKKKDIPAGLWAKCPECQAPSYTKELENNFNICSKCNFHFSLGARKRIELFFDDGSFIELDPDITSADPLEFQGPKSYKEKL